VALGFALRYKAKRLRGALIFSRVAQVWKWNILGLGKARIRQVNLDALECNINMLLISLMDDTQPYRAEVRDRCVHSNFSYLHRSIIVNLMMFLLSIYQTYSKGL